MAETPISLGDLNPFGNFKISGLGAFGNIGIAIVIAVVILILIGVLIYLSTVKKQYFLRIRVFRNVGNIPTEVMSLRAREVPLGMAGDKLWRVAPNKVTQMPFKIVKWLPVGKKQTSKNEFWYWIREDGEWINFILSDIDELTTKAGVKFVSEDMRLQRLATDRLLEQRLMNKTFWEKYGTVIMTMIFFLVIAVCMVIIFYQWGKLIENMNPLVNNLVASLEQLRYKCGYTNSTGGVEGLIPIN